MVELSLKLEPCLCVSCIYFHSSVILTILSRPSSLMGFCHMSCIVLQHLTIVIGLYNLITIHCILCVESSVASRAEILRDCVESNLLKAIAGQKLLPAIKVLTDWLRLNGELVLTCVEVRIVWLKEVTKKVSVLPSQ